MKRGCAHVKGLYTVPGGSGTQLADGAAKIKQLGLKVLKIYLTSDYLTDYPLQSSWSAVPTTLTELVQTTQYQDILADSWWETIIFTGFTFANGSTNWWRVNPSNAKFQAEYDELYDLGVYLLGSPHPARRYVIQNWEGDWALMDVAGVPATVVDYTMIPRYAAFLAHRQLAVADARKDTASASSLAMAVELNRVVDAFQFPARRRIIKDIAKRLQPDIISYSAYDSTIVDQGGWGASTAAWIAATTPVFTKAIRQIKAAFPGVPIQIGEYGFPENEAPVGHDLYAMNQLVNDICEAEGIKTLVYWEVFDNEQGQGGPGTYRGYWFFEPDGTKTIAGQFFEDMGP